MKHLRHNTTIPSAMFLITCASLVFFLPVAISMTAPAPTEVSDGVGSKRGLFGPSALLATGNHDVNDTTPNARHGACEGILQSSQQMVDTPGDESKKSSLPLEAAAIIGSCSAVAAAFLTAGGSQ
ncbi:MAG: hypothetical protein PVJ84_18200 [Desulfobacteraceae bacterium]|jgi:hypothetical protein